MRPERLARTTPLHDPSGNNTAIGRRMPYFTAAHVSHALAYLPEHTHQSLVSFLGMLKAEVPISATPSKVFGSVQETALMRAYFRPEGGSPNRPWYVPFGRQIEGGTHWKPKVYAGTSLQRMRKGKAFIYVQGTGASNDLWSFHPDFLMVLATQGADVIGTVPISIHNLAAWCYRRENIPTHQAAIDRFIEEFELLPYKLVGNAFDAAPDPALSAISLTARPIPPAQILALLQPPPVSAASAIGATAGTAPAAPAKAEDVEEEADYTWEVDAEDVRTALGNLQGMDEAAFRALAARRAGMHIISWLRVLAFPYTIVLYGVIGLPGEGHSDFS
jgi:5-methylcytosine-specific restriction protein B